MVNAALLLLIGRRIVPRHHSGCDMTKQRVLHLAGACVTLLIVAIGTTRHGDASTPSTAPGPQAFTSPRPRAPGAPVRVLVYHDMEGLAGQDDWQSFLFSHPEKYPAGQKLLAADIN